MKNYGDLGGCYLDLHKSSQDTHPNSLIVNYEASSRLSQDETLFFLCFFSSKLTKSRLQRIEFKWNETKRVD